MEIRNLCCSTSTLSTKSIQLGRPINLDRPSKARSRWRSLWRRIKREKRKIRIFDCNAVTPDQVHVPGYDPYTYAQNFDQGLMWDDEPDSLSRSFSMRFAAPTRLSTSNSSRVIGRSISDLGNSHQQDVVCVVF